MGLRPSEGFNGGRSHGPSLPSNLTIEFYYCGSQVQYVAASLVLTFLVSCDARDTAFGTQTQCGAKCPDGPCRILSDLLLAGRRFSVLRQTEMDCHCKTGTVAPSSASVNVRESLIPHFGGQANILHLNTRACTLADNEACTQLPANSH